MNPHLQVENLRESYMNTSAALGAILKPPKYTSIGLSRHGVTCLWQLNVRKPRPTEDFAVATEEDKPTTITRCINAKLHNTK